MGGGSQGSPQIIRKSTWNLPHIWPLGRSQPPNPPPGSATGYAYILQCFVRNSLPIPVVKSQRIHRRFLHAVVFWDHHSTSAASSFSTAQFSSAQAHCIQYYTRVKETHLIETFIAHLVLLINVLCRRSRRFLHVMFRRQKRIRLFLK